MKKVLILTCSTGEGHNSAAHAIETILCEKGIACELTDPVSFKSDRMSQAVSSVYNTIIKKTPTVFGAVYKLGHLYCSTKLPSPILWANSTYADALRQYIVDNAFDAVISTHLYGMEAMTVIRKDPTFTIPCFGVMTDYTVIPFMTETSLTGFFAPQEDLKEDLISKGMPRDSVFVSGIPVNQTFVNRLSRAEARSQLGIADNQKMYLIMTGGIGCENMMGLCDELLSNLPENAVLFVLTGKNNKLKAWLDEKYADKAQLHTVAFTRQVAVYMAAADVMLSKPGGLSSTEAAVANVPLVHVHEIPGCETYNARFFAQHGLSIRARSQKEAVSAANYLAYNREAAETMRAMQRKHINPHAAEYIVEKVMEYDG